MKLVGEESLMKTGLAEKGCMLIPAYKEGERIAEVVDDVLKVCPNVVVVDDGSPDDTAEVAENAGATVLVQEVNQGKGAALNRGFEYAREKGYEFVVTLDGDGQHAAADIPAFIDAYAEGMPVIIGNRMSDTATMPLIRRLTNQFMSWLLSRKMGQRVPDTQNGFRLYKTDVIPKMQTGSQRFAAESEILLELAANGVRMGAVPIKVIYRDEKSKINPVKDTWRFFKMLRSWESVRETQKG
jgi:glycosyltransferase involved in cell wall biosynthesis